MNPTVREMRERIAQKKVETVIKPVKKVKAKTDTSSTLTIATKRKPQKTLLKLTMNATCYYCGIQLTPENATIDHYIPLCRGGTDDWDNKVFACIGCNNKKGNMLPEKFEKQVKTR